MRALLTAERPQPPEPPPAPSPAASPPPATDDDDAVESSGAAASTSEGLEDDNDDEECDVPDSLLDFLSEHVGDGPVDLTGVAAEEEKDEEKEAFTPITWDIDCNAPADGDTAAKWIDDAAASLSHNGFCVLRLPTPIIPTTECSNLATSCVSRLNILFDLARKRGIEPKRDIMRFTEVCCRTPGGLRYDMRFASEGHQYHSGSSGDGILPPLPSSWDELYSGVEAIVRPILTKQGNDTVSVDSAGCVTSLPRAPDQHFHPDGTAEGLINCFVPLVPVDQENGPTELRPGSHVWVDSPYGRVPRWDERTQLPVCPNLLQPAQDLLLFDYRVYHRGQANRSAQPRPVGYLAFACREGLSDTHNFPREASLVD